MDHIISKKSTKTTTTKTTKISHMTKIHAIAQFKVHNTELRKKGKNWESISTAHVLPKCNVCFGEIYYVMYPVC